MTTCVAECTQAGLKHAAYKNACVLVRPEFIDQVNAKFKKKVESIARKPVKQDDDPEPLSPCPHCQFAIPETCLDCINCKNTIPFCIASGKHMSLNDWTHCPSCKMCSNFSDLKKVLEAEPICPMCEQQVHPMSIKISDDAASDFKALVTLMKEQTSNEDEIGNESDEDNMLQD
jgi:WD repeat-containing protein 19